MSFNLKSFQKNFSDEISSTIEGFLQSKKTDNKICIFQSPTGSGKTLMLANAIYNLIKDNENFNLCFLWVTIGKGDLHIQSKINLEKYLNGYPKVMLLENEFGGVKNDLGKNNIVVTNWEKLRNKDKDGDWKNILMKDGEHINFREILANTKLKRKIVLVIDESHIGANTERTLELKDLISADVTVEVSATPKIQPSNKDLTTGIAKIIYVPPNLVIEEGLIKKEILINPNLEIKSDTKDSFSFVMEAALNRREKLKKLYEEIKIEVNPLVLIQVPNSELGDEKINEIKNFFLTKKIKKENVAIWLSDENNKINLENITKNQNEVNFLIFKQAIDTGWDCPRAQILVKFREIKSETFEIQTVGRILRMPEAKHYDSEELNVGYIFTDLENVIIKKEEYNLNIIKHLSSKLVPQIDELNLKSYYIPRVDYGDLTSNFIGIFEKNFCNFFNLTEDSITIKENIDLLKKKGINFDNKNLDKLIVSNIKISSLDFDNLNNEDLENDKKISLKLSINELQRIFENWLLENITPFSSFKRSLPKVKSAFYNVFEKYLGSNNWENETISIQNIILEKNNNEIFKSILTKAIVEFKKINDLIISEKKSLGEKIYNFNIPKILFYNEFVDEEIKNFKKYSHTPCYLKLDRSQPEKEFEIFLEENQKIRFWWKNGEGKTDYFSIKYKDAQSKLHCFYPDYIAIDNNEKINILEVKSDTDRDGLTDTKYKAEAIQNYIKENSHRKLLGGIVIKINNSWLFNNSSTYDWDSFLKNDLKDWKHF
jgi:type III restriction enzyme